MSLIDGAAAAHRSDVLYSHMSIGIGHLLTTAGTGAATEATAAEAVTAQARSLSWSYQCCQHEQQEPAAAKLQHFRYSADLQQANKGLCCAGCCTEFRSRCSSVATYGGPIGSPEWHHQVTPD